MPRLTGSRVLLTGASSGIGTATALRLAEEGADVALVSRSREALEKVAGAVRERGTRAVVLVADVTDRDAVGRAVDEAAEELGGLDAVIANAGAAAYGPFRDMPDADVARTFDVTLQGTVNVVSAALPHLERSAGSIVATGSVAAKLPMPLMTAYSAAKHGVRGFLESLRLELRATGSPVRVAMVHPGPVNTPFWKNVTPAEEMPPELPVAYDAEKVAEALVDAVAEPRPERTLGLAMRAASVLHGVARPVYDVGVVVAARWAMGRGAEVKPGRAIWEPAGEGEVEGGI